MDSKKFLIFRIVIISLSALLLVSIELYQRKLIEEEKAIEKQVVVTEDNIIDAAKIYISNNPDYFSEIINEKDFEVRINIDDLVKSNLIDKNSGFNGYIKVINNEFSFVSVNNKLIDNLNSKDYKTGVNNEKNAYDLKYIYKGENPNNYVKYNGKLYRIIGITNSKDLKLIDTENSVIENWGLSGDINYLKTDETNTNNNYKGIFYVGYVRSETASVDQVMKNEKRNNTYTVNTPKLYSDYSYVNISDIINSCENCQYTKITEIKKENCDSYLISMLNNTYTSNTLEGNMVYKIDDKGNVIASKLEKNINVKKVIYVSALDEYKSGDGTKENPYIIK